MTSASPVDNPIQFTLRAVFAATTAIALLLAAVAPFFRQLDTEGQWRFAETWGYALAGFLVQILAAHRAWRRVDRQGGRLLFRLDPTAGNRLFIFHIGQAVAMLGVVATFSLTAPSASIYARAAFAFALGMCPAWALDLACRRRDGVELHEFGASSANGWLGTWEYLRSYAWSAKDPSLLHLQFDSMNHSAHVPPEHKAEVEQFLAGILAERRDRGSAERGQSQDAKNLSK